jgi:hypothetical protein
MVPRLRRQFEATWSPARYAAFQRRLADECGGEIPFRLCETPCFFPPGFLQGLADAGRELILSLVGNADYLAAAERGIPPAYRVPEDGQPPLFVQVDFGLTADRKPRLVEIQAFPSLYAFQPAIAEAYRAAYDLGAEPDWLLGGLTSDDYRTVLRQAIVADHDPENVVLLEIHPDQQKTRCDFVLTERICGVRTVCLTQVRKQGNRLVYPRAGRLIPIERIYNRVIVDELIRKQIQPPFDYRDELEVEWAGHPNWYFKISKYSLPWLDHLCVPRTRFLNEVQPVPADLENYVLKPLYSFAGLGVKVGPTAADLAAVPEPTQAILQERVAFHPCIATPAGPTQAELRIMFIWQGDGPRAVTTLVRMGRGAMMGVDHNRNLEFVGASAAFTVAA